jgi:hypothetical protein
MTADDKSALGKPAQIDLEFMDNEFGRSVTNMGGYTKIYGTIFDGTLATIGPWQALVTFEQFLILCDKDGVVDMMPGAISRRTTIPLDIIEIGIAALEAPDPDSRRPDENGKRLVRLDAHRAWGWRIVNYLHYRNERDEEERRKYQADWARRKRATRRGHVDSIVDAVSTPVDESRQSTKSTTSTATATKPKTLAHSPDGNARVRDRFPEFWTVYPRKTAKDHACKTWHKLKLDDATVDRVLAAIAHQARPGQCLAGDPKFIPHPATWLNQRRWEDEIEPASTGYVPSKKVAL